MTGQVLPMEIPGLKMEKRNNGRCVSPSDFIRIYVWAKWVTGHPSHQHISSLISLQQYGLEEYALTKRSFVSPELCLFHLSSTTLQPKRELTRSHGRMIIIIHPFAVSFKNQIQIQRSTTGQCLHCVGSSYWMARARRESGERWVFLTGGWEDPRHWAVVLSKT